VATVKDQAGRDWLVAININTVLRIKAETGIDLLMFDDPDPKKRADVFGDIYKLTDIITSIVNPQLKEKDVSVESFYEQMKDAEINEFSDALADEMSLFFQGRNGEVSKGKVMAAHLERSRMISKTEREKLGSELMEKITSGAMDAMIRKSLSIPGNSSSDLPGKSDNTPAPTQSEN